MARIANIPEIRFAGFTDPWEQRRLGELLLLRRGLTYSPLDVVPANTGTRVLRSSNIDEDKFVLSADDVFVRDDAASIDEARDGDILITAANGSSRLVGKHAVIHGLPARTVHGGFMLLGMSDEPDFINSLMSAPWFSKFLSIGVAGGNGAIGNLDMRALGSQEVRIPNKAERRQIGAFFSRLDSLITLTSRKLELLRNVKKSLLDKMFV